MNRPDLLIDAGVPIDATDPAFGRHPLRIAASEGHPVRVRRLRLHGADPGLRDPASELTPLELCRKSAPGNDAPGHVKVETILEAVGGSSE